MSSVAHKNSPWEEFINEGWSDVVVQLMLQESGFRIGPFGTIWGDPDLFHGIPSEISGLGVWRVGNVCLNVVVQGKSTGEMRAKCETWQGSRIPTQLN